MKISVTETYEYDLTSSQIRLIKYLRKNGPVYLHGRMADTADKTPGVGDEGEGKYYLTKHGRHILINLP